MDLFLLLMIQQISIHAPSRERRAKRVLHLFFNQFQSTLPRGSDDDKYYHHTHHKYFNPRSPHGERPGAILPMVGGSAFQSTLPARGATALLVCCACIFVFQSTLPARGATPASWSCISISRFQSTLPARGATRHTKSRTRSGRISIHAPRTGSDTVRGWAGCAARHFNPRSPHGERLKAVNNRNG